MAVSLGKYKARRTWGNPAHGMVRFGGCEILVPFFFFYESFIFKISFVVCYQYFKVSFLERWTKRHLLIFCQPSLKGKDPIRPQLLGSISRLCMCWVLFLLRLSTFRHPLRAEKRSLPHELYKIYIYIYEVTIT